MFDERTKIFVGTSNNNKVYINLEDCPHILISGMTGSGKSVLLNHIICELINKYQKYSYDFLMIDTKRVELSPYKQMGKDDCLFVCEYDDILEELENICYDIDFRYEQMEKYGWRKLPSDWYRKFVIIEELGDLMYVSKKQVEQYLTKIARLGRACGIHLIIATQRPVVSVVTGEIKANIGCRFALQTTSTTDSINILGHKGAEKLRGKGDCLLKLPTMQDEIHIQCPYIDDCYIIKTIEDFIN